MLEVPVVLAENCAKSPERRAWLERLPLTIEELQERWALRLGTPFDGPEVSAAWVAPATRSDGSVAVLKVSMPHMEADHEAAGLRFWDGHRTVRLLDADDELQALLLERCEPGTWLRLIPEEEQDVVLAGLLRELWRTPDERFGFRPLRVMIEHYVDETRLSEERWPDPPLVRDGLAMFTELAGEGRSDDDVLLATDLHAGNVLRAQRSPWLVIDPKPFVGDRAYDATQHLFNCEARMQADPVATVERFSRLLEVEPSRVRRWMFARGASENRDEWTDDVWTSIARSLSP